MRYKGIDVEDMLIFSANIGACVLFQTAADTKDDLQSFAEVLTHLFLPLNPRELDLEKYLQKTPYDFFVCVRESRLTDASQVRTPILLQTSLTVK